MKILITGGAGFIGSHLSDALLAAGHEITIIDDLSSGTKDFLPEEAETLAIARNFIAIAATSCAGALPVA